MSDSVDDIDPEIREVREATASTRRRQGAGFIGGGIGMGAVFLAMWLSTDALTDIGTGLKADVTVGVTWGSLATAIAFAGFGLALLIHTSVRLDRR